MIIYIFIKNVLGVTCTLHVKIHFGYLKNNSLFPFFLSSIRNMSTCNSGLLNVFFYPPVCASG